MSFCRKLISSCRNEAIRRNLQFNLDLEKSPKNVIGDAKKIRTVVSNLTANAGKPEFAPEAKISLTL